MERHEGNIQDEADGHMIVVQNDRDLCPSLSLSHTHTHRNSTTVGNKKVFDLHIKIDFGFILSVFHRETGYLKASAQVLQKSAFIF